MSARKLSKDDSYIRLMVRQSAIFNFGRQLDTSPTDAVSYSEKIGPQGELVWLTTFNFVVREPKISRLGRYYIHLDLLISLAE